MNETILLITALAVVLAFIVFAVFATIWKKKRKYRSSAETEQFLNKEIEISEKPALETKVACVQPISRPISERKEEILEEIEEPCGYLYFTIKYDDKRSMLLVKLIKGENIPSHKSYSSKPYIEIQILPVKAEPISDDQEGIQFPIMPEELVRQTVHFCICRYDTFSRKTTVGDVFLSLAELTAEKVNLSQEIFMKSPIKPNIEVNLQQDRSAKDLWNTVRMAIHAGKIRQLKRRSFIEQLTWDTDVFDAAEIKLLGAAKTESKTAKPKIHESVKNDGPLGTLFFSLKYDASRSRLVLRIMKAEDIPDHDGQVPNVMVECALLPGIESEKPFASAVQESTFTPVFEETFEYKVDFEDLWKKKLHLIVWYVDPYSHLKSLGEVIHPLGQLDMEGFDISETAMLFSKEIMLLHRTQDYSKETINDFSSILFSLTYLPATNRLGVLILKARDLKTTQDNRGVYVEVSILHRISRHRKTTSFKTGTHNPHFNEALLFDLKNFLINDVKLQITVFQKVAMGADTSLGRTLLGKQVGGSAESHWVEALTAAKPTAQWHQLQPCPAVKHQVQGISAVKTKELRSFEFPKSRR